MLNYFLRIILRCATVCYYIEVSYDTKSLRRVNYGKVDGLNKGEDAAREDRRRVVTQEVAKGRVRSDAAKMARAAALEVAAMDEYMCDCQWEVAAFATRLLLATEEMAMRGVSMADAESAEDDFLASAALRAGLPGP